MFASNFCNSSRMISAAFFSCCTHTFHRLGQVSDCAIKQFDRCRHGRYGADTITAALDLAISRR